jgi:hypothetical protein
MREFGSFGAFAEHLVVLAAAEMVAEKRALDKATKLLQREAKAKIGEYQPKAGSFAAWAELAESTQEERERLGYPANEPLLREGTLRNSIERQIEVGRGEVGSNSEIAEWMELGTSRAPPRSFLGSAAVENADKVVAIVGEEVTLTLAGEGVFRGAIPIVEEE